MHYELFKNPADHCHFVAGIDMEIDELDRFTIKLDNGLVLRSIDANYVLACAIDELFDGEQYTTGFRVRNSQTKIMYTAVPSFTSDGYRLSYTITHQRSNGEHVVTYQDTNRGALIRACDWIV